MKYARIHDGFVVEICTPLAGFSIEECFHADLIDKMVACDDEVQTGWSYVNGVFTAPVVEETTTDTTDTTDTTQ